MYGTHEEFNTPVYGVIGEFADNNTPGNRYDVQTWSGDGTAFWMFSGAGANVPVTDDLWTFSTGVEPASAADWQLFE